MGGCYSKNYVQEDITVNNLLYDNVRRQTGYAPILNIFQSPIHIGNMVIINIRHGNIQIQLQIATKHLHTLEKCDCFIYSYERKYNKNYNNTKVNLIIKNLRISIANYVKINNYVSPTEMLTYMINIDKYKLNYDNVIFKLSNEHILLLDTLTIIFDNFYNLINYKNYKIDILTQIANVTNDIKLLTIRLYELLYYMYEYTYESIYQSPHINKYKITHDNDSINNYNEKKEYLTTSINNLKSKITNKVIY